MLAAERKLTRQEAPRYEPVTWPNTSVQGILASAVRRPGTVFYVTELLPWFAEALRHNEQLMRDTAQMIESLQRAAARQMQQRHRPALMFTSDIASAMDAGMAQFAEAFRGQAPRVR